MALTQTQSVYLTPTIRRTPTLSRATGDDKPPSRREPRDF